MKSSIYYWSMSFISCILTMHIINRGVINFYFVCPLYFLNFSLLYLRSIEILQKVIKNL